MPRRLPSRRPSGYGARKRWSTRPRCRCPRSHSPRGSPASDGSTPRFARCIAGHRPRFAERGAGVAPRGKAAGPKRCRGGRGPSRLRYNLVLDSEPAHIKGREEHRGDREFEGRRRAGSKTVSAGVRPARSDLRAVSASERASPFRRIHFKNRQGVWLILKVPMVGLVGGLRDGEAFDAIRRAPRRRRGRAWGRRGCCARRPARWRAR